MRYLLICLCSLVAGCGDTFTTPVNREYTKESALIVWKEVDTEAQLNAACHRSVEDRKILACAEMGSVCTIYTYRNPPLETLGHETLHCFTGRWHG